MKKAVLTMSFLIGVVPFLQAQWDFGIEVGGTISMVNNVNAKLPTAEKRVVPGVGRIRGAYSSRPLNDRGGHLRLSINYSSQNYTLINDVVIQSYVHSMRQLRQVRFIDLELVRGFRLGKKPTYYLNVGMLAQRLVKQKNTTTQSIIMNGLKLLDRVDTDFKKYHYRDNLALTLGFGYNFIILGYRATCNLSYAHGLSNTLIENFDTSDFFATNPGRNMYRSIYATLFFNLTSKRQ